MFTSSMSPRTAFLHQAFSAAGLLTSPLQYPFLTTPNPNVLLSQSDLSMQLQMYVLMKNQLTIASAAATVGDIEKNGDLLRQKIEKEESASDAPSSRPLDSSATSSFKTRLNELPPSCMNSSVASSSSGRPFSIDSLLQRKVAAHEVKTEPPRRATAANRFRTPSSSSSSIALEPETAVYTLDALEGSDGRARSSRISEQTSTSANHLTGERSVCEECGKSYATSSNLSRHKQTHRPIDSPHAKQCPHCDRVYVSMPALSMHILTHNASHTCEVCGKSFSRLWLLQGHMRSHTGTRPFGCAHCGKYFADRSNLRAHILTHTGVKKFACDGCGKRFALRSYLNRHMESACKSS